MLSTPSTAAPARTPRPVPSPILVGKQRVPTPPRSLVEGIEEPGRWSASNPFRTRAASSNEGGSPARTFEERPAIVLSRAASSSVSVVRSVQSNAINSAAAPSPPLPARPKSMTASTYRKEASTSTKLVNSPPLPPPTRRPVMNTSSAATPTPSGARMSIISSSPSSTRQPSVVSGAVSTPPASSSSPVVPPYRSRTRSTPTAHSPNAPDNASSPILPISTALLPLAPFQTPAHSGSGSWTPGSTVKVSQTGYQSPQETRTGAQSLTDIDSIFVDGYSPRGVPINGGAGLSRSKTLGNKFTPTASSSSTLPPPPPKRTPSLRSSGYRDRVTQDTNPFTGQNEISSSASPPQLPLGVGPSRVKGTQKLTSGTGNRREFKTVIVESSKDLSNLLSTSTKSSEAWFQQNILNARSGPKTVEEQARLVSRGRQAEEDDEPGEFDEDDRAREQELEKRLREVERLQLEESEVGPWSQLR